MTFLKEFKRSEADEEDHLDLVLSKEAKEITKEYEDGQANVIIKFYAQANYRDLDPDDAYRSALINIFARHAESQAIISIANTAYLG